MRLRDAAGELAQVSPAERTGSRLTRYESVHQRRVIKDMTGAKAASVLTFGASSGLGSCTGTSGAGRERGRASCSQRCNSFGGDAAGGSEVSCKGSGCSSGRASSCSGDIGVPVGSPRCLLTSDLKGCTGLGGLDRRGVGCDHAGARLLVQNGRRGDRRQDPHDHDHGQQLHQGEAVLLQTAPTRGQSNEQGTACRKTNARFTRHGHGVVPPLVRG